MRATVGDLMEQRSPAFSKTTGLPTISLDLLYAFVVVRLDRRTLVWTNVTGHPTAEWIARQITEAFPWDEAPRYLIRDRDGVFGATVTRRLRAMGIRDKPIAPASPWQNAFAERWIGSIRRECVDHLIVFGERHLHSILRCYAHYYNEMRTHRSLNKDAPTSRAVQRVGNIKSHAVVGGLHHHYVRISIVSAHTAFSNRRSRDEIVVSGLEQNRKRMDHARARMVHRQSPVRHSFRRTVCAGNGMQMFNSSGHTRKS